MILRTALLLLLVGAVQDVPELRKSGSEKLRKGDYAGAIQDLSRVLEQSPNEWIIYLLRSEARKESGDVDGAIADATKAIALQPNGATYAARAAAKHRKEDLDGAIQDYTEALRLRPKETDFWVNRGAVKLHKEDLPGAIADCKKALELNPKEAVAYHNLGSAYLRQNDFDAALSAFSKVIEVSPGWSSPYFERARAGYRKGDYAAALKDAERAYELLGAEDPDLHLQRACCQMARGNAKKAKEAFDQALKAADGGWKFRRRAESLLSVLPDLAAGSSTVPFPRRILEKGRILFSKGDTDKAIEILEEALLVEPKSPDVYEALVGALLTRSDTNQGDRKRARALVFEAVGLGKGLSPRMQKYLNAVSSQVLSSVRWLAHHQMADGRWSGESVVGVCRKDGTPQCDGKGKAGSDLRATGLAVLALLGAGYSQLSTDNYDTKPLGETVKQAQQWMLAQQKTDGSFGDPASERFLEDHAIVTLAMSESYGMTAEQILEGPAQKAVDFLVASRGPGKGWAVKSRKDAPDSVATGWALIALQSARRSELKLPPDAMDQGLEWLIGAALKAPLAHRDGAGTFAVAAAALLGMKLDGDLLKKSLTAVSEAPPGKEPQEHDALFTFVSAVALRVGDNGALWQSWRDHSKSTLQELARFDDEGNGCPAGSWDAVGPADGTRGRVITTALNTLALETSFEYVNNLCTLAQMPDYARGIAIDSRSADALCTQGNLKKDKGDLDGAIADYTRAIEVDPKYATAYTNRGNVKLAKGDLDGSIADHTRAIEIDPKHSAAYFNRAYAKERKDDLDGSIADYTRAIEIEPKYAAAYSNRGNVKKRKGDVDGAVADYTRAIEVDPKFANGYYNRGNVKKDRGDLDGSVADYTRVIEVDPKYAAAYYKRGSVKQAKGDLEGAIADYTRTTEADPKYNAAYYYRGALHYNAGSWKEAVADFQKSAELDPANQEYPRFRVWLSRSRMNERDAATKELARFFEERKSGQPGDWPSKIAQHLTGALGDADFLKAAESNDPKTDREQKGEAYFYAGSRRLLEGDKAGAKEFFQKCLDAGGTDSDEYASAAAELKRLER
jgi:tetratricopeptide (TPR) repeat protein